MTNQRRGSFNMSRQAWWLGLCVFFGLGLYHPAAAADPLPKVVDPRLKIELFAEHPQIVTPTGIDIDAQGRVWAVESNTHFPPEGYRGHKTDRLLVMRDADGDGRADEPTVFADGLVFTMSVAVRPPWYPVGTKKAAQGEIPQPKHSIYAVTRREVLLLHDDDGDLKADRTEQLLHLDTKGDYPHDGLGGISFDALGWMYVGFGENLGADYKIIGSDGATLSGGGEGGNIYRCRLDGTGMTRWATGFWNPHANCVDAYGRLFSVDNDADSRPPCRLLHIIPGGDYGYRYRNGRKGLHPFTAWNGEIPGTLPMVAGTGEAPSGIVAYEGTGLPADFQGNLLVGSWGDHRIDRFQLKPKGTSYTSLAEPIVIGNENFRPVGLAVAPDGSLYFTDWVLREYKLHSQGRIWRISAVQPPAAKTVKLDDLRQASIVELFGHLTSNAGPVRHMAAYLLSQSADGLELLVSQTVDRGQSTRSRLEAFWATANIATQQDPPTKLLLTLRSLAAVRSLTGNSVTTPRGGSDDVGAAGLWLSTDTGLPTNPVISNLLRLVRPSGQIDRGGRAEGGNEALANAAVAINEPQRPDRILPFRSSDPDSRFGRGGPGGTSSDASSDPFLFAMTVQKLSKVENLDTFRSWWTAWQTPVANPTTPGAFAPDQAGGFRAGFARQSESRRLEQMRNARLALVLAARARFPKEASLLTTFLADSEPLVRRLAVQWIAEERLKGLRPGVEALLQDASLDSDLFLTTLAALEMLDGVSPVDFDKTPASKYVLPLVTKDGPPTVRKLALRLAAPADPVLTVELYKQLLATDDEPLRLEAVRTLQLSPLPAATDLLLAIASGADQPPQFQAEALAGLAAAAKGLPADGALRQLLDQRILGDKPALRTEALRALRGTAATHPSPAIPKLLEQLKSMTASSPDEDLIEQLRFALAGGPSELPADFGPTRRPATTGDWYQLLGMPRPFGEPVTQPELRRGGGRNPNPTPAATGNADAGRRTFFHVNSAGCAKCHTVDGRGGKVGPDLTNIARTMDRMKLAQSILEPSREMSPQFVAWTFELKSGKVLTGLILSEESEKLKIGTADGQTHDVTLNEIETRTPQSVSLMPEKLIDQLTVQEFRDLLAFLETLK